MVKAAAFLGVSLDDLTDDTIMVSTGPPPPRRSSRRPSIWTPARRPGAPKGGRCRHRGRRRRRDRNRHGTHRGKENRGRACRRSAVHRDARRNARHRNGAPDAIRVVRIGLFSRVFGSWRERLAPVNPGARRVRGARFTDGGRAFSFAWLRACQPAWWYCRRVPAPGARPGLCVPVWPELRACRGSRRVRGSGGRRAR